MIDTKTLLCVITLMTPCVSQIAQAKCNSEARVTASELRLEAASEPDIEQAIYLLRSSSQMCEDYNTWIALGRREIERNDPDFAVDYFNRARDMYHPDDNGEMSVGKLRRLAMTHVLLASALNDAKRYAEALDALETSKRFFSIYKQSFPERLLSLQASIDDGMSSAPTSTLTRSMSIQRTGNTRGVGIRVKPQETSDEFISEDTQLLQQEDLADIIEEEPLLVATAEQAQITPESPDSSSDLDESASDENDTVVLDANEVVATIPESMTTTAQDQTTPATRLNIQVLFDFDSDQINATGEQQVTRIADALRNLQLPDGTQVQIIGHTDINGSAAYNLNLSERRATTVVNKISSALPGIRLSARGMGETKPRYPGTNRDDHRRNRRVEIVIN